MKRRTKAVTAVTLLIAAFCTSYAAAQDRVFWTDSGAGRIERANLDGSERVTLIDGIGPASLTEAHVPLTRDVRIRYAKVVIHGGMCVWARVEVGARYFGSIVNSSLG